MINNKLLIIFAVLIAFTFIPLPVSAVTYDSYTNNGSWQDYNFGLDSTYYQSDLGKPTYNRDYASDIVVPANTNVCSNGWCGIHLTMGGLLERSIEEVHDTDDYSLKFYTANQNNYNIFAVENEIYGDVNVTLWGLADGSNPNNAIRDLEVGYIDDQNNFTRMALVDELSGGVWEKINFVMPTGNYKLAFYYAFLGGSTGATSWYYISEIDVVKTNAGSFNSGFVSPSCSSIDNCSNISSDNDLNSNSIKHLYWIADYVSGASCSVTENGGLPIAMTEMSNGMYYYELDNYGDVNVELNASCIKVPYSEKNFFVSAELNNIVSLDSDLVAGNSLSGNSGNVGALVTFYADYTSEFGDPILDSDCNITIGGVYDDLVYNSATGYYEVDYGFISTGTYEIYTQCGNSEFIDRNSTYNVTIGLPFSSTLTISDLDNVASSSFGANDSSVNLDLISGDYFSFSIVSLDSISDLNFYWEKSKSTKQYYAYTSSDGVTWVFDSTLTFGSGYNNPIQKVLSGVDTYSYSVIDDLTENVKKYYKFTYRDVADYWETITDNSDWLKASPTGISYNSDLVQYWDLYNDSNYSNILVYTTINYPDLTTTDLNSGFELQFNAYSSVNTTIKVGYRVNGVNTSVDVPITTSQTRYSVPVDPSSDEASIVIYSESLTASQIYITDYAVIPKAYFTRRLKVLNDNGEDLTAMLLNGSSQIVIQEGQNFRFSTGAYDKDSDLATLKFDVSLNGTIVKTYEFDLSTYTTNNRSFDFMRLVDGVIDINGYYGNPSSFRDVTFKATLIDDSGNEVEEQYTTLKLLQYPFFDNDISLDIDTEVFHVGVNPQFDLTLSQKQIQSFLGLRIRVYDSDSNLASPDYETIVYNTELNCGAYCQKSLTLDGFVYEKESLYVTNVQVLLNTESDSIVNPLVMSTYSVNTIYKQFETARILQTFERADDTYRNDEKLQFVLQLRDIPHIDLKDRTNAYVTIDSCPLSTGACDTNGTTKFYPKFHYYDGTTGYNYFYFSGIFYNDDGTLLNDGNYIRFNGHIEDKFYSHDDTNTPIVTMAGKCDDVGFLDIGSMLYNYFLGDITGCISPAPAVVEIHGAKEKRVLIDEDFVLSNAPNQSMVCIKPNNTDYKNTLKQDLFCVMLLKRSDISIDLFNIIIGNNNSDYQKTGVNKQYLDFSINADDIIFNDPFMMKQAIRNEYSATEINTIGEFMFYGFDKLFSGIANPLAEIPTYATDSGIIKNLNWDLNFDDAFDPNYLSSMFFIKISGLEVTNQQDYIGNLEDIEYLDPKNFREYLNDNDFFVKTPQTNIMVFASAFDVIVNKKVDSPLIINEDVSSSNINQNSLDENNTTIVVPNVLKFDFTSDMIYQSGASVSRISMPLILSTIIEYNVTWGAWVNSLNANEIVEDSLDAVAGTISNPIKAVTDNWFVLFMLLGLILVGSLIYSNLKSKGIVINNSGR